MGKFIWGSLFLGSLVLVTSCGDKLPELNDAQKARLRSNIAALGAIPAAVSGAHQPAAANAVTPPPPPHHQVLATTDRAQMESKLATAFQSGACQVDWNLPAGTGQLGQNSGFTMPSQDIDAKINIAGASCPIQMGFALALHADMAAHNAAGNFTWNYAVSDPQMASYNDVTAVNMSATFQASGNGSEGSASFGLGGTIQSAAYGTLKPYASLSASGNQSGFSGEAAFGFEYADGTKAEIGVRFEGSPSSPKVTYLLQRREVSLDELAYYFADLQGGIPSLQGSSQSDPSPVVPSPAPQPWQVLQLAPQMLP